MTKSVYEEMRESRSINQKPHKQVFRPKPIPKETEPLNLISLAKKENANQKGLTQCPFCKEYFNSKDGFLGMHLENKHTTEFTTIVQAYKDYTQ